MCDELGSATTDVQVWWVDTDEVGEVSSADLSPSERARLARITVSRAATGFLVGRLLTRRLLGLALDLAPSAVPIQTICRRCGCDQGKPHLPATLPPISFSVSHSGRHVAMAMARGIEVGLDLEAVALRGADIPHNALSAAERQVLSAMPEPEAVEAFIRYWTRKEALVKATGDGLTAGPRSITISPPDQPAALVAWTGVRPAPPRASLMDVQAPAGFLACVAMLGDPLRVRHLRGEAIVSAPARRGATAAIS